MPAEPIEGIRKIERRIHRLSEDEIEDIRDEIRLIQNYIKGSKTGETYLFGDPEFFNIRVQKIGEVMATVNNKTSIYYLMDQIKKSLELFINYDPFRNRDNEKITLELIQNLKSISSAARDQII